MGRDVSFNIAPYDPDKYGSLPPNKLSKKVKPLIPDKMPNKSDFPGLPDPVQAKQDEVISVIDKLEGFLLYHSTEINKLVGYIDNVKLKSQTLNMVKFGLKLIAKGLVFLAKRYKVTVKE